MASWVVVAPGVSSGVWDVNHRCSMERLLCWISLHWSVDANIGQGLGLSLCHALGYLGVLTRCPLTSPGAVLTEWSAQDSQCPGLSGHSQILSGTGLGTGQPCPVRRQSVEQLE